MAQAARATSLDEWRGLGSPVFRPWAPPGYRTPGPMTGGLRLLILGESHYTMRKEEIGSTPPDYTMDVMQEGALVGKPYRLFRKVADLFACGTGDAQPGRGSADFWNAVAFCNFVPVLADGRPAKEGGGGRRPEHWAFKAGTEAIAGLLDRLEPQVVVACGIRLWGYLAPHLDGFTNDPHGMDVHDDGRHVFGKFYHPSARAFCPQTWSARARALLDLGKDSRAKGRRWLWAELGA